MTKFGKAGKTGCFDFLFRIVQFQQFQNMNRIGARIEDLKIKDVLRSGKILKGDKEPTEKNSKPKSKVENRNVQFWKSECPIFLDKVQSK
jgi:hypothetical protein